MMKMFLFAALAFTAAAPVANAAIGDNTCKFGSWAHNVTQENATAGSIVASATDTLGLTHEAERLA